MRLTLRSMASATRARPLLSIVPVMYSFAASLSLENAEYSAFERCFLRLIGDLGSIPGFSAWIENTPMRSGTLLVVVTSSLIVMASHQRAVLVAEDLSNDFS